MSLRHHVTVAARGPVRLDTMRRALAAAGYEGNDVSGVAMTYGGPDIVLEADVVADDMDAVQAEVVTRLADLGILVLTCSVYSTLV